MYGYEVSRVAVYQSRYIVGRTHATLLLVRAGQSRALHSAGRVEETQHLLTVLAGAIDSSGKAADHAWPNETCH